YGILWEQDAVKHHKFTKRRRDPHSVFDHLAHTIFHDAFEVRASGSVVSEQTESEYCDTIKQYVWEEEADTYTAICNALESFFQKSGKFTISRLRPLEAEKVMHDTNKVCYKYFQNGFVEITASTITFKPYSEITGLVWEHKVRRRNFNPSPPENYGVYAEYLENAIGITPYLKRVIGNLSIDYKDESNSYIFVLT